MGRKTWRLILTLHYALRLLAAIGHGQARRSRRLLARLLRLRRAANPVEPRPLLTLD